MNPQFTHNVLEAFEAAVTEASNEKNTEISELHVLEALLQQKHGYVSRFLAHLQVDIPEFSKSLHAAIAALPKFETSPQKPDMSRSLITSIQKAEEISKSWGDSYVSTDHLLVGFFQTNIPFFTEWLRRMKHTPQSLETILKEMRGGKTIDSPSSESSLDAINKYCKNLTEQARKGKLDPVIGRDEEIRRAIQVLSRRTKNNPLLIGEPGVGKTAIAEGLAHRIIQKDVPDVLHGKELVALDMGSLIAGTKFRGEFEERLKGILDEISKSDGQILLFIDEVHTLVGAGATEGAMDAANLLKPALSRGELHCIGATTLKEYQKYIEKDAALERRFQSILVNEPTLEDAISILRGLKERYENFHGVKITEDALHASVMLSSRYITDRQLPDKAIDLIDEAASLIRMQIGSVPLPIDTCQRELSTLIVKHEAIKREKGDTQGLQDEIDEKKKELEALSARWEEEKKLITTIKNEKNALEKLKHDEEEAERASHYERVAEIRYKLLPQKVQEIKETEEKIAALPSRLLQEEVDETLIAQIVAKWTGIPVQKMLEHETEKLLHLEHALQKRVIGQQAAITAVSDAIRRSRSGLSDPKRPLGAFLFLGPTGVGKTELAKALAETLFDNEDTIVRIDMSEYMEKHSVSKLIGAPPGYIGHDDGGLLTETLRRRPYSVVLLDEVEKAHTDVYNILLQVFDDGRITDSKGRVVNCKNALFIMTSNLQEEMLKAHFRPEFINRLDEILVFNPLQEKDMEAIVEIQLSTLAQRMKLQGYTFVWDSSACALLAKRGYDPIYGARPLKRLIQNQVVNTLSKSILQGDLGENATVKLSVKEDELITTM